MRAAGRGGAAGRPGGGGRVAPAPVHTHRRPPALPSPPSLLRPPAAPPAPPPPITLPPGQGRAPFPLPGSRTPDRRGEYPLAPRRDRLPPAPRSFAPQSRDGSRRGPKDQRSRRGPEEARPDPPAPKHSHLKHLGASAHPPPPTHATLPAPPRPTFSLSRHPRRLLLPRDRRGGSLKRLHLPSLFQGSCSTALFPSECPVVSCFTVQSAASPSCGN